MTVEDRTSWRIVEASVTGPHHVRNGLPNQDAHGHREFGPGLLAIAVADGAGSAARADEGSQLAVAAALDTAETMLTGDRPYAGAEWQSFAERYARGTLRRFDDSLRASSSPAEFATTLLSVIVAPPWFVCFSIGDGFLLAERDPGGIHLLVPPPLDREFMGGTVFLTSPERVREQRLELLHDPRLRGLALCTDGLIEGLLNYAQDRGGRACPVAPPETIAYFDYVRDPAHGADGLNRALSSNDFAATSGDDKTVAMVVR
ncbi:hypothetical protein Aab01nite_31760 [Paractinoplanes abujensis]|uniref:PPM-type phosphatase domain-containing protein n=1 Tax=Paractinoplanes abujensis TaxID=882441 RepID=A0A7W7D0C4_9ACTN|nr:PP2C family serine/threonine-protein phosphatase [Actinoplanes abujensis]MBB4697932.1 hypothetical protein [Actinoplanes abujensis]GID19586.1 hypothetical protein Aab01nite_31760 [Actinoplanes abujensis]